jgi:hypothetical protein
MGRGFTRFFDKQRQAQADRQNIQSLKAQRDISAKQQ